MRGRLIANGILSILVFLGWVVYFLIAHFLNLRSRSLTINPSDIELYWRVRQIIEPVIIFTPSTLSYCIPSIASFVMGIITLIARKDKNVQGLTIASGIIGILFGLFPVNAIVSFVAVYKINKSKKIENKKKGN